MLLNKKNQPKYSAAAIKKLEEIFKVFEVGSEDMPYATTRDLTKTEKVFKPEEIQKMKNELMEIESIQPPFGKEYEIKLLNELGGEQLEQLIKRENAIKKKWTGADEANLIKRKKGVEKQTLLQDVEGLIKGTDYPVYSMKGKLTVAGQENATKSIHEIDEMLNELLQGDKFDFLGKRKEGLITRLQDKSVEIQERFKKSGVKVPGVTKKEIDVVKTIEKVNIDETINSIKALEPIEAMKEANNVAGKKGIYADLTDDEVAKILGDTEDHILQRDIK